MIDPSQRTVQYDPKALKELTELIGRWLAALCRPWAP